MSGWIWGACGLLFLLGLAALVLRRQLLVMFMGLELMVVAASLALAHEAGRTGRMEGYAAALLVLAVAAGEAVVGLSLILNIHWSGRAVEVDAIRELRG
ncbi:MAG TPA: NADH-quinone oxidoreductase subunit NuoK [Elusimicrobia bacterium]|nr:NADH-quinone oxidoreductase subunit NuoK [Elusimicrobiota bacterium]HBT61953.1 NADH-quinone oxidoreductase subunit NuoK [Elusimicrobiota bacterium]